MFAKKSSQIIVGIVALVAIFIVGLALLITPAGVRLGDEDFGNIIINGKRLDISNCRPIPPQYAINILPLGEKNSGVQFVADKHTLSAPYYLMYETDNRYEFHGSEIPSSSITISDDSATIAFQHPVPTENKVIRVIIADSTGCFEKHFDHVQ